MMGIFNVISSVRVGLSDKGEYKVSVDYWAPIVKRIGRNFTEQVFALEISKNKGKQATHTFKFKNMNAANLFVGYCVYPFFDQDLGLFSNKAVAEEKYFFDDKMTANAAKNKGFISFGHKDVLQQQRKNMTKNILHRIFSKSIEK